MPKATCVTVEASTEREVPREEQCAAAAATSSAKKTKKTKMKQKITPLPLRQLVPMTFVLLNESLCGTMLMPFTGFLVSFLEQRDTDEAGYFAGLLVAVFAIGQLVSSRFWGAISDKYGRRLPLISGLFAAGIMMLGFGLSGSVWLCAFFRFLQGMFNGNVLVAKTMMADITDKTNQAQGFAFVSFVSSIGLLLGPLLGGLLYDPTAEDSSMRFLGLSSDGIFARRPALLPALLIFFYSMVGMAICTFFVQESNPDAQPIPHYFKLVFPCLLVPAKEFEATPMAEPLFVTDSDADNDANQDDEDGKARNLSCVDGSGGAGSENDPGESNSDETGDSDTDPRAQMSATFPVAVLGPTSPIALEDTRRFDQLMEERWMRHRSSDHRSRSSSMSSFSGSASMRVMSSSSSRGKQHGKHRCRTHHHHHVEGAATDCVDSPLTHESPPAKGESKDAKSFTQQFSFASTANNPMNDPPATRPMKSTETAGAQKSGTACVPREAQDDMIKTPKAERETAEKNDGDQCTAVEMSPSHALNQCGEKTETGAADCDEVDDSSDESSRGEKKTFGVFQAFANPVTRFMLVSYIILCASDMTVKQCFPLWAISSVDKGGLGFSSPQVSHVLLLNAIPTLVSNYFFAIACRRYANKIGLFRVGLTAGAFFGMWTPLNYYVGTSFLQFVLVAFCCASQQFFSTWCYGLNTMLTARSAPPGQVGALMGLSQSCGSLARGVVPILTGPMFAWSISGNHPLPFNHVFVFFAASISFMCCWFFSYKVKTINDTELALVTNEERFGPVWLRSIIVKIRGVCGCKSEETL